MVGGFATVETGLGIAAALHGADWCTAALASLKDNEMQQTVTSRGIEKGLQVVHVDPQIARPVADITDGLAAAPIMKALAPTRSIWRVFRGYANPEYTQIEEKLSLYLLNLKHPDGGSKAKWLREALGFNQAIWEP